MIQSEGGAETMLLRRRCDAPLPGTFAEFERRTEDAASVGLGSCWSSITHNPSKQFARYVFGYSDSHYASNDGTCLPEARFKNMYNYANAMLFFELFHTTNHLFNKFCNTELDNAVNALRHNAKSLKATTVSNVQFIKSPCE